jgi:hypothetical protein
LVRAKLGALTSQFALGLFLRRTVNPAGKLLDELTNHAHMPGTDFAGVLGGGGGF